MVIYEMINESRGTPILLRGEMEKQGRRRGQRARGRERDRVRASRVLYLIIGRPIRVSETLMTACVRRARPFATSEPSGRALHFSSAVFNAVESRGELSTGARGTGGRDMMLSKIRSDRLLSPSTRVTRQAVPPVRLSPKGVKTVARATSTFPTWRICRRTRRTARRFRSMQARASVTAGWE